ncbi:MAG TPA: AAA family ATPase [Candidatus Nanoarchaeia archaeon]|nr:AAA family ATPase [Candidatus Nanoarchaeia archaeon]
MVNILFIYGAPGTGKTTISNLLNKKLKNSVLIDLGHLREFHLNAKWSNTTKKEEKMSFENLCFIIKNYVKNRYKNIIVNDLLEEMIIQVPKIFKNYNYKIISLIVDDKELERRINNPRDSGYKNVEKAVKWNNYLKKRQLLENETKIENSHNNPEETVKKIIRKN